ncbi:MAG: SDR family NAD(P)-dependent oxidoreductase [Bacteroidota bacterium]
MKKTILITGSTDGIGKLAAIQLAQAGHSLYVHGRNSQKLADVIEEIKRQSQNEHVSGFVADFSDLHAVKAMAQQVVQELPKLDILINNAGVFKSPVAKNADGLDLRWVVNYLAPYVLTNALLPLLKKGEATRIINLSSAAQAPVSLEALEGTIQSSTQEAYAQSKLALTMWSFHLAKTHPEIAVIALNPGSLLNTRMVQEAFGRFWAPADKGAQIINELSLSDAYKGITGAYFDNDQGSWGKAHVDAYNEGNVEELIWKTDTLLGKSS